MPKMDQAHRKLTIARATTAHRKLRIARATTVRQKKNEKQSQDDGTSKKSEKQSQDDGTAKNSKKSSQDDGTSKKSEKQSEDDGTSTKSEKQSEDDGSDEVELINADGSPDFPVNQSKNDMPKIRKNDRTTKTGGNKNTPDNFVGEGRETGEEPCVAKKAFQELEDKVQTAETELLEDTERMKDNEQNMMKDEQEAHQLVQEAQKQLDEARRSFEQEQHQLLKVAARWKKNATKLFSQNQDLTSQMESLFAERLRLRKEQESADHEREVREKAQTRRTRARQGSQQSEGGLHSWRKDQRDKKAGEAIQKAMFEMEKWKEHSSKLEAEKKKLEETAMKYFNEKERYQQESRRLLGEVKDHVGEMHKNDLSDQEQLRALSMSKEKYKTQLEESRNQLAQTQQEKQQLEQALAGTQAKYQESVAAAGTITEEQLEKDAQIQAAVYAELERLKAGSKQLEGEREQYKALVEKLNHEKQDLQKQEAILMGQLQQAMGKIAADKNQLQDAISKTMVQQIVARYEDEKRHLQGEVAKISKEAMDSKLKADALGATVQQWRSSAEKLQGEREAMQVHITSLADQKTKTEMNQADLARRLQESAERVGRITSDTMKRNMQVAQTASSIAHKQMEGLIGTNQQLKASVSTLTEQLNEAQRTRASLQTQLHEANMRLAGQNIESQDEATKGWMKKLVNNAELWKNKARQLRGENDQLRQAVQQEGTELEDWKNKGVQAEQKTQSLEQAVQTLDGEKSVMENDRMQVAQQLKDAIVGVAEITEKKLKEGMQAAGISNFHSKRYIQDRLLQELQKTLSKLTGV